MSAALERLNHLNLNHLYAFVAVAEHNSFTAAAEAWACRNRYSASSCDAWRPTSGSVADPYHPSHDPYRSRRTAVRRGPACMLGRLDGALSDVRDLQERAQWPVAHHRAAGLRQVAHQQRFRGVHPAVSQGQVEMLADDQFSDLVGQRIDLAVRIGWPRDSGLHASKLWTLPAGCRGDAGIPRRPAAGAPAHDLARCEWIGHTA